MGNASLQAQVPDNYSLYLVMVGMCSCELYQAPESIADQRLIALASYKKRLSKRGWSESKVKRAIQDKAKSFKPQT